MRHLVFDGRNPTYHCFFTLYRWLIKKINNLGDSFLCIHEINEQKDFFDIF